MVFDKAMFDEEIDAIIFDEVIFISMKWFDCIFDILIGILETFNEVI